MNNSQALRAWATGASVLVIQLAIGDQLRVLGTTPEFLVLFVIVVGFCGGSRRGATVGFGMGLVADIFSGFTLGTAAGVYALVGYLVGMVSEETSDYSWVAASMAAAFSALAMVLVGVVGNLSNQFDVGFWRLVTIAGVVGVFNALLAPIAIRALRGVWRRGELRW